MKMRTFNIRELSQRVEQEIRNRTSGEEQESLTVEFDYDGLEIYVEVKIKRSWFELFSATHTHPAEYQGYIGSFEVVRLEAINPQNGVIVGCDITNDDLYSIARLVEENYSE